MKTVSFSGPSAVIMFFLLLSTYNGGNACNEAEDTSGLPGNIPEILAPGSISTEMTEARACFSPDCKKIYFTRHRKVSGTSIYMACMKNGKWDCPKCCSFRFKSSFSDPHITMDGNTMFFASDRLRPRGHRQKGNIWMVKRRNKGWTKPEYIKEGINDYFARSISSSNNRNLYFTAYREGEHGIYTCKITKEGYSKPELLPLEVNHLPVVSNPCIAPDESYLLFQARHEGSERSCIFISNRDSDGNWSLARRLPEIINATRTEGNPVISPNGEILLFSRNGDLYWVSTKCLLLHDREFNPV